LGSLRLATVEASSTTSFSEVSRQFGAMANSLDAVSHIVNALKQGTSDHNIDTQIAAAGALCALLPLSSDIKTRFLRAGGVKALAAAISTIVPTATPNKSENSGINSKNNAHSSDPKHQILTAALLQAVAASTTRAENNKCAAMEAELGSLTLQILQQSSSRSSSLSDDTNTNAVVLAVCAVLSSLTTADDESLPGSRAFPNARQLAKQGAAEALVTSLRIYATTTTSSNTGDSIKNIGITAGNLSRTCTDRDVIIALCGTLRQVAANDDICQEAAGSGAVPLALQLADEGLDTQDTGLLRAALNVLKQLASSDGIKAEIYEAGGLETLKNSLKVITGQIDDTSGNGNIHISSVAVVEQALGLLTNMTLRNPEISTAAVSSGCVVEVLRAMHALLDTAPTSNKSGLFGKKAEASMRQGCMALRNIAARCPEERQVLLAEGAEKLLREVKEMFPSSCQDVGSAALRDLGLDNYNN